MRRFGDGKPQDVESINRGLLSKVHAKWYIPSNTVVTAVGRVSHKEIVEHVGRVFPISPNRVEHTVWDDESGELPETKEIVVTRPARNKSIVVLGSKIPQLTEEERVKLLLFMRMMARGMNSILFREMREKRGLVYTVSGSIHEEPKLANYICFVAEALPEVTDEVSGLLRELVLGHPCDDRNRFELVQGAYRDTLLASLESVDEWFSIIDRLMIGEGKNAEEFARRMAERRRNIAAATLRDVLEFRKRIFNPDGFVSVVVRS